MAAIALFLVLVAVCVLAAWFGVDSRPVEHDRSPPELVVSSRLTARYP